MTPQEGERGLDTQTLARVLGGRQLGATRPVTILLAPTQLGADRGEGGVIVLESAAQLAALRDHAALPALGALIVPEGAEADLPCPLIVVAQPRLAFAQLSALFAPPPPAARVSAAAHIDPGAVLAEGVSVGVGAVIGAGCHVGAGCRIGAGCVLGDGVVIGENTVLHAQVTLYPGVRLGRGVILHSGVVVGADGFGYALSPQGALKIHHLGTVVIEDEVEVGANSCIDRGTLGETRIGARSKIDNLCQIGHNVTLEPDCLVAGASAVGGSTVLERGVILGGGVAVTDHVRLGAGARIGGRSSVTKSVPAGETWAGYPAKPQRRWVRELYLLGKLETLWTAFKALPNSALDPALDLAQNPEQTLAQNPHQTPNPDGHGRQP